MVDNEISVGTPSIEIRGGKPPEDAVWIGPENRHDRTDVYIELGALDKARADGRARGAKDEAGGAFLGRTYLNPDTGRICTEIVDYIPGLQTVSNAARLTFTADTWAQMLRKGDRLASERQDPSLRLCAWFHTHPGWGTFLSNLDIDIQDGFFNEPGGLAVVFDPIRDSLKIFSSGGGDTNSTYGKSHPHYGYYVFEESPPPEIKIEDEKTETVTPEQTKPIEQIRVCANTIYGFALKEYLKDIVTGASPPDLEKSRQVAVDLGEHGLLGGNLARNFIKERGGQQFQEAQESFRQAKTPEEKKIQLQKIQYLNKVAEAYQQLEVARQTPGNIENMIPEAVRNSPAIRIINRVDTDRLKIGNETFRTAIVKTKLAEALAQTGETVKLPLISSSSGLKIEYELTPQMLRELAEILAPRWISDAMETNVGRKRLPPDEDSAVAVNPSGRNFSYTKIEIEAGENKVYRKTIEEAGQSPLEKSLKSLAEQGIGLWTVADGMGGAAAGEKASAMALESLAEKLAKSQLNAPGLPPEAIKDRIIKAIEAANQQVYEASRTARNNMGSTLTGVINVGETAYIFNVGDSRAYLLRQGEPLKKITKDHSLVQYLVDQGKITEAEVRTHPQRNEIWRNIGGKLDIQVDIFTEPIKAGDQFIICCDGLWEMMLDEDIQRIAEQNIPESEKVRQLVELANENGGDDNITVMIARF